MLDNILASSIVFIAFMVIIFLIIYIMNSVTLKKTRKHFKDLQDGLKPGREVMLNNGIYGKLVLVKEKYVEVEIARGVTVKADRFSIKEIL